MEQTNEEHLMFEKGEKIQDHWALTGKVMGFIVLVALMVYLLSLLLGFAMQLFSITGIKENWLYRNVMMESCLLASICASAWIILKYWEHLPFSDLGLTLRGYSKDILWGALMALILYAVGFGVLLGIGMVEVTGVNFNTSAFLWTFLLMMLVAFAEEIALRGFLLGRLLHAGIHPLVALLISSLLFALMHIFNPNFSWLPFLNILLAGFLLGATYLYTRNLCFPIALHFFWNWLQGPVLGFEVSGSELGGTLLTLRLPEQNIINGGTFGFEGSILCTALMIISILLIFWIYRKKKMV